MKGFGLPGSEFSQRFPRKTKKNGENWWHLENFTLSDPKSQRSKNFQHKKKHQEWWLVKKDCWSLLRDLCLDHFLEVFDGQDLLDFSSWENNDPDSQKGGAGPTRHKIYLLGAWLQKIRSVEGSIKRLPRSCIYENNGCNWMSEYSKMLTIPAEPISWCMQRPNHIVTEKCHDWTQQKLRFRLLNIATSPFLLPNSCFSSLIFFAWDHNDKCHLQKTPFKVVEHLTICYFNSIQFEKWYPNSLLIIPKKTTKKFKSKVLDIFFTSMGFPSFVASWIFATKGQYLLGVMVVTRPARPPRAVRPTRCK